MFKVLFVLVASFCVAYASVSLAPLEEKPEKFKGQEGCYISDLDQVIPVGQSASSNAACQQYTCGQNVVQITGCGAVHANPTCKLVEDISKPYPGCCPRIVC